MPLILGGVVVVAIVAAVFVGHALIGGQSQSTSGIRYTFLRQLGAFKNPEGVAVGAGGNVYVTDGRQQLHFSQLFAIFRRA